MEIIIGKTAGFCYGVKRAIEGVKKEVNEKNQIFCLGDIVHNKQVIDNLKQEGAIFIENIFDAKTKDKVLIRAHGIAKDVYEIAKKKDIELKDYTCPNVLKIHSIAGGYSKKGYYIFLCGSKNHPENIGTISYCGKTSCIIENEDDVFDCLEQFKNTGIKKLLMISQTTYSLEKFYILEEIIKNELKEDIELIVKNTICRATELRQKETLEISKEVDYMIIVGGTNSSNTKKLYEIARKNCNNSICIETAEELKLDNLKEREKIGIMAGASTPKESIDKVYMKLKSIE